MFKFASKAQKLAFINQAHIEKAFITANTNYSYSNNLQNTNSNNNNKLFTSNKFNFSSYINNISSNAKSQKNISQNFNSLYFVNKNNFITAILAKPKIEKRIQSLEQEIEGQLEFMTQNTLEKINELIDLKTQFFKSSQYLGYVQDLQKKSNTLFSIRQTDEALNILQQIEKQVMSSLELIKKQKNKDSEIEYRNLKIELVNNILMRIQMQDSVCTEKQAKQSVKDCLIAIQYLEEINESMSDHMVVAQQTLGEAYYKLGDIQQSAEAIEKAAFLLDQLISDLSSELEKKQSKQQQQANDNNMRHLLLRQAICYETLGNLHFDLRNMQQVEVFFTAALSLWENRLSQNKNIVDNTSNTLDELIIKATQQSNENKNIHPLHMRCMNSVGTFYSTTGQSSKALQVLGNAKKLMSIATVENADNFSWVLLNMAKSYYKQQQYETSYKLTLESEEVARQFQISSINLAQILEHKSSLLTMQAQHKESSETIDEALSLFKDLTQEPIYCRLLFSRGMQCIQTEQYEKAIEYALKSKQLVESIRGPSDEQVGDALRILGMAYCSISFKQKNSQSQELFNQGIKYLEQAIQIFSNNNDTRLQDSEAILGDLANIYEIKNNFKKAIMSYEQQRTVRIHVLESVGLPSNTDEIVSQIEEKIVSLYAKVNASQKN